MITIEAWSRSTADSAPQAQRNRCPADRRARTRADFGVVGVVKRAFDRTRDHRPPAVVDGGMIDDAMAKERPILHEAEHDIPPGIGFIWFLP